MDNPLNDTQTAPDTQNPQESVPNPGASNSADFQSTASDEVLRQEAKKEVTVESTGQPISADSAVAKVDNSAYFWALGSILAVIVGVIVVMKFLRQEESQQSKAAPASAKPAAKATVVKKTAKKAPAKSAKKKSTSKKRSKSSKRR